MKTLIIEVKIDTVYPVYMPDIEEAIQAKYISKVQAKRYIGLPEIGKQRELKLAYTRRQASYMARARYYCRRKYGDEPR